MKFKLSDHERQFIIAASHAADTSNSSIAKILGLREHKVRYLREKLVHQGIIKPSFLFNPAAIGLTAFGIYFNRGSVNSTNRRAFEKAANESPSVFWFSKVSGAYQYGVTYLVQKPYELENFFDLARAGGSSTHFEKRITIRTAWTIFSRNYLARSIRKRFSHTFTADAPTQEIDPTDAGILTYLGKNPDASLSQIARDLAIRPSTLSYRIEQLKKRDILLPPVYSLNRNSLDIVVYRFLVVECGLSQQAKQSFIDFCAQDPHVVSFIRCTGDWDFELRVEGETAEEVQDFAQAILDAFGQRIASVTIVQEFASMKSVTFRNKA